MGDGSTAVRAEGTWGGLPVGHTGRSPQKRRSSPPNAGWHPNARPAQTASSPPPPPRGGSGAGSTQCTRAPMPRHACVLCARWRARRGRPVQPRIAPLPPRGRRSGRRRPLRAPVSAAQPRPRPRGRGAAHRGRICKKEGPAAMPSQAALEALRPSAPPPHPVGSQKDTRRNVARSREHCDDSESMAGPSTDGESFGRACLCSVRPRPRRWTALVRRPAPSASR